MTGFAFSLTGRGTTGAAGNTILAGSPENKFGFAKHALAQRGRRGRRHVVPVHVLDASAAIANEMMVPRAFGVEAGGATLHGYFPHQTRLHQVPQIVIGGGAGAARIEAIHGVEDFGDGGMAAMVQQKRHDGVTLRSAAQAAVLNKSFDLPGGHEILDYV